MKISLTKKLVIMSSTAIVLVSIGAPNVRLQKELPPVYSVAAADSHPTMCIGFNPEKNKFGEEYLSCPKGYAYYSVGDPAGKALPGETIITAGGCCPLPADDILTEEKVDAEVSCPENYIATGMKGWERKPEEVKFIQCTKINDKRYKLGEMTPAKYWGNGFAGWQGSDRIDREIIPAGIRYSVGRENQNHWGDDGCVGYPWGSLFAKKTSKYCGGMFFRQLQFAGVAGDPPAGTPVKMFPDCDDVNEVGDPNGAKCVKKG